MLLLFSSYYVFIFILLLTERPLYDIFSFILFTFIIHLKKPTDQMGWATTCFRTWQKKCCSWIYTNSSPWSLHNSWPSFQSTMVSGEFLSYNYVFISSIDILKYFKLYIQLTPLKIIFLEQYWSIKRTPRTWCECSASVESWNFRKKCCCCYSWWWLDIFYFLFDQ